MAPVWDMALTSLLFPPWRWITVDVSTDYCPLLPLLIISITTRVVAHVEYVVLSWNRPASHSTIALDLRVRLMFYVCGFPFRPFHPLGGLPHRVECPEVTFLCSQDVHFVPLSDHS